MAVSLIHGLRRLAEIMEVTQLVWHIGAYLRDGTTDGQWAVRHDADKRHLHGLPHGPEQDGEVGLGCGPHTAGQEDFPREAVPQAPQPLMADVRLEAIQCQEDPALDLGDALQASGISEGEGEQFVVALEQRRDRPRGDGHPAVAHVLMDFGQTTVLRRAQGTDACHAIEAKLVLG